MLTTRRKNYRPTYRSIFDGFFDQGINAIQPINGIDSIMNGFLNDFDRNIANYAHSSRLSILDSVPKANVSKNDQGFTIRIAAPGLSRNDFDINIENNVLTVKTKVETEVDDGGYKEFDYMNFERSWTLPKSALLDRIEANYEAGILVLDIPYEESSKDRVRKIEVK